MTTRMILRDLPFAFRHMEPAKRRVTLTSDAKSDARWSDAILLTASLWLFVLLILLPVLMERHGSEGIVSIALDAATILISMLFALLVYTVFRATLDFDEIHRTVILSLAIITVSVAQSAFDLLFTGYVAHNLDSSWAALPRDLARAYDATFKYICVFAVNVALFQLSFARRRTLSQERQLAAARSTAQQAQLEALRLQLNPHFLFNTLNAISAMIVTRRNDAAEEMTDRLSNFLRASLAFDPTELVSVDEEFAIVDDYLQIEQVRFGERLIVHYECSADAGRALVPGLIVQPLVENAIKYGVARSRRPVTLAISAVVDDGLLCITVADNGAAQDLPTRTVGTGVGLRNIRARLAALYGDRGSLAAEPNAIGFVARICLPAEAQAN